MIGDIGPEHYADFLRMNAEFVHWLAPMDKAELERVLGIATYARQIGGGQGVLIGYPHDANYPDHKNLTWLRPRLDNFFYIDRIIIDGAGYGGLLYDDVARFARENGYDWLACEVNTKPNNPGSHAFHTRMGFTAMGEADYPEYKAALRYYKKDLQRGGE